MVILQQSIQGDITVRLIETDVASFAILYQGGNLHAVAHRTADRACAHATYNKAVELASIGFTHRAWRMLRSGAIRHETDVLAGRLG